MQFLKEIMHEFEFETGNPLEIPLINPSVQNSIDLSWETNDSMLIDDLFEDYYLYFRMIIKANDQRNHKIFGKIKKNYNRYFKGSYLAIDTQLIQPDHHLFYENS